MSNNTVLGRGTRVSRDITQAKLDRRIAASTAIRPRDPTTIADRVEQLAREAGNRLFLAYGEQRFSYAELEARANQFAHAALAHGIRPGAVCAIALENRPEFYFAWFGLLKIGAVVAFLNTNVNGRALVHAITSTGASFVIVGEECQANFSATPELPAVKQYLLPDPEKPLPAALRDSLDLSFARALDEAPRTAPPRSLREGIRAEQAAVLVFTSGTTGLPKAAVYSLPLYHGAASLAVTSTALKAGAAIALRRKFSVRAFWHDIRLYKVTVWQYIGEVCRYLANQPPDPADRDHGLRCIMGAGFNTDAWNRWVARFGPMDIYEGWGGTESNTNLINVDNYPGSVGRVPYWEKTNFRLLRYDIENDILVRDEDGFCILCEPGEIGEGIGLIVTDPDIGGGRFEGYTSAEATEKKILRNVFRTGDAYWCSGDLLRYDADGYFYFIDRIGDTFRWKSENVSTQEVSETLAELPGAELINIYGVTVPGHEGRAGMAAVVMQPGCEFDPEALYALTEARLPRYAAPLFVRIAPAAELTSTYKLRKVDLQAQGYDPRAFDDPLFVRDEQGRTYQPYSIEALERAGLPPFRQ
jgi:fatty-acyl-CoA synthase